jgi:long-chain acyl-CoA synthetase
MHPSHHARSNPGKAALIVAETGETVSYAELDARSNRAAHLYRRHGLKRGDVVAFLVENHPCYFEMAWGAQRSGLLFVGIPTVLTAREVDHILADSGAKLLVTSQAQSAVATELATRSIIRFMLDGATPGFADWDAETAGLPDTPIADESAGADMVYSSGTTGTPRGIRVALPDPPNIDAPTVIVDLAQSLYGMDSDSVYLSPAPLYHAAPLRWSMAAHRLGATVVIMKRFDAAAALATIERFRVTHSQWVPAHFVQMLKLPPAVRTRYDLSSMKVAIHAAAPCPIPIKHAMIDWWGPIIHEYYAGSEGTGLTGLTSAEWLAHPGSVGRAMHGIVHICDEDGDEVPQGSQGLVYFESPTTFAYHNDPVATAAATNKHGWTTLNDIGCLDPQGYLYLKDRKSFVIVSEGVSIYPQEIENLLITHPAIADVAVIGAPNDALGEEVVAVIEPVRKRGPHDALAAELDVYCRAGLAPIKVPRRFDFVDKLPRHATGKLYKRLLRDRYWGREGTTII